MNPPAPAVTVLVALAAAVSSAARPLALHAQDGEPIVLAEGYVVPSTILEEDRPVQVALPPGYDSTSAYPVVYVMDGPGHLVHTVGTTRFLAENNRMPAAIVVAIANTEGNRTRNMTPPLVEADPEFEDGGGSADFRAFMRDELKPWVGARWSTRPYDVLIGHSFGGLFIADVLKHEPDLFDAYLAISPSLWWDDERFVAGMDDLFERFPDARGSLYMTMGNEGGAMLSGAWRLASTLEKHAPEGFRWHWQPMPTETHGSVPARSTYDGLEWVFSDWYPLDLMTALRDDGAEALPSLRRHYAELSERVGWEVQPSLMELNGIVYQLGDSGDRDGALELARGLDAWFPDHHLSRLAVGMAHMTACEWPEAIERHAEALALAEAGDAEPWVVPFIEDQMATLQSRQEAGEVCPPGS